MTLNFNLTGAARKTLARVIGDILDEPVVYMGTPTFAFNVNGHIIDRHGALIFPDEALPVEIDELAARLKERGYVPENNGANGGELGGGNGDLGNETRDENGDESAVNNALQRMQRADLVTGHVNQAGDTLSVEIPRVLFTDAEIANIRRIVAGKETVIKKALGVGYLPIEVTDETISFPWFNLRGVDGETDAYIHFIFAIGEMARRRKYIAAAEHDGVNDKLAMRLFLVRLGFVGAAYKTARKILLRNLTGNSAWKYGGRPSQATEIAPSVPETAEVEGINVKTH